MKGFFVTFEGIEGCGKSTQAYYLYEYLINSGRKALLTREPGGTESGAHIRDILLNSSSLSPYCELFLFLADRSQHVEGLIRPALEKGSVVICDRFYHSTFAYQAGGRHVPLETVEYLNDLAIQGLRPDITFLIDINPETGMARKHSAELSLDRIEKENGSFHKAIRDSYLKLAEKDKNIAVINGERNKEIIRDEIIEIFLKKCQK